MRQPTHRAGHGAATLALGENGRACLAPGVGVGSGMGRPGEFGSGSTEKAGGSRWKRKESEVGPRTDPDCALGLRGNRGGRGGGKGAPNIGAERDASVLASV